MSNLPAQLTEKSLAGEVLTADEGLAILRSKGAELTAFMAGAHHGEKSILPTGLICVRLLMPNPVVVPKTAVSALNPRTIRQMLRLTRSNRSRKWSEARTRLRLKGVIATES